LRPLPQPVEILVGAVETRINPRSTKPESDDSLATWNLLDAALEPGAAHPVRKSMPGQRLDTRPLP
jgi:hypothetical protein